MYNFDIRRKALKNWLRGRDYYFALRAMHIAEKYHTGFRKDGKTPTLVHQVTLAQHARSLEKILLYPEATISVLLLHDMIEDVPHGEEIILSEMKSGGSGSSSDEYTLSYILAGVESMTKFRFRHVHEKTDLQYYLGLQASPIGSIAKGIDRCHNIQTMVGVFTKEKQISYCTEVRQWILPMMSKARELFPQQEAAYHNVKHTLLCQLELLDVINS